jgi:GAF domain-containing protein
VNADPAIDLGPCGADPHRPLRSCLAAPVVDGDQLVAVLAFYSATERAYADDHVRLLDLLSPRLASALAGVAGVQFEAPAAAPTLTLVKTPA